MHPLVDYRIYGLDLPTSSAIWGNCGEDSLYTTRSYQVYATTAADAVDDVAAEDDVTLSLRYNSYCCYYRQYPGIRDHLCIG